jgi:hypothetical protein
MPVVGLPLLMIGCEVNESPDIVAVCSTIDEVYSVGQDVQVTASISGRTPGSVPETFVWQVVEQPTGSEISILFPELRDSSFTPPVEGDYVAEVTITDFDGTVAEPCQVSVYVNPEPVQCWDGSMSNAWPDLVCPPEAVLIFISGATAIDASGGSPAASAFTGPDGVEGTPGIELNFLDFTGADLCAMTVTPAQGADLSEASWSSSNDDVLFGYSFGDAPVIEGDCGAAGLDPAVFTDDVDAFIAGLDLGLAVTVPDPDLYTAYEEFIVGQAGQGVWDADWAPFVDGFALYVGELAESPLGAFQNDNLVFHYSVDESLTVEYDDVDANGEFGEGDTLLTLDGLGPDGAIESGYYEVRSGFAFDARCITMPELCVVEEE